MHNTETILTAGAGIAASVLVGTAPISDWSQAITQLLITVAMFVKLFKKPQK